ncbi:MAG TPA: rhomboid family intramembrane serine protease [Candidatus Methylacidiphilales bacterium]
MHEEIPAAPSYEITPRRPIAWVTWTLVGSTFAVFLLQLLSVHLHGDDVVGNTLAFSSQAWAEGRYWTLITYAWAHAVIFFGDPGLFWLHIVANMLPLICLGPAMEELLGRWRFLGLYLGGAIASVLVWFIFNPDAQEPIIGASGAVFALIAAAGTAAPRARVIVYFFFVLPIPMSLRVLAITACGVELAFIILNWMPEVAHTAHLGGAAFGFLYILGIRLLARRRATLH